jgi:hypothetical protein
MPASSAEPILAGVVLAIVSPAAFLAAGTLSTGGVVGVRFAPGPRRRNCGSLARSSELAGIDACHPPRSRFTRQRIQKLRNNGDRVGEINPVAVDCGFVLAHVEDEKLVVAVVWSDDADVVSFTDPELILAFRVKDHGPASSLP